MHFRTLLTRCTRFTLMRLWEKRTEFTHFCTCVILPENHEKPRFQNSNPGQENTAEKGATSDPHERATPLESRENGRQRLEEGDRRKPFAPCESNPETMKALLTSVIQAKNRTPDKKPADSSNAARPAGDGEKKMHTAQCPAKATMPI